MYKSILFVAVPAVIGTGILIYNKWRKERELYRLRSDMVEIVNNTGDMDDVNEANGVERRTRRLRRRLRYNGMPAIIKAIQHAEVKVGILKKSEANRMVVDKIIRDYMVKPVVDGGLGMRNCDAVRNYIVAVNMYFLPRHQSVVCKKIGDLVVDEVETALRGLGLDGSY